MFEYYIFVMNNELSVFVAVRVPKSWGETLDRLAAAEYLSKSDIVRRAIKEYLDRQAKVFPAIHKDAEK